MHEDDLQPLADRVEYELDAIACQVDHEVDRERLLVAVYDVDATDDADQRLDGSHRLAEVHSCKQKMIGNKLLVHLF